MIAIPSVRGNGPTGWLDRLKDMDVADPAPMKSNRSRRAPRRGGFAGCDFKSDFVTRPITMMGRGAFDVGLAPGKVGIRSRCDELPLRLTPASSARPSAWSGLISPRLVALAFSPFANRFGEIQAPRRLARTTMRTTPRSHRDRPLTVIQVGCRFGSSSGKGVRAE